MLHRAKALPAFNGLDPRWYQIAALTALLGYGAVWLRFDVRVPFAALILGVALLTQFLTYREETLPKRLQKEAETLANLTGWALPDIHKKAGLRAAR